MSGTRSSQSKQDKADNELILYRLQAVENAVRDLTTKFDKLDNIKKDDLKDLSNTIVSRITDVQTSLQRQVDNKVDRQEFKDYKKQLAGYGAVGLAILVATYSYLLTRLH